MRWRYAAVAAASVAIGVLAGWAVGSVSDTCEHSCPARGPCPEPPDCGSTQFHWAAAIVVGLVAAATIAAVALALLRRSGNLPREF